MSEQHRGIRPPHQPIPGERDPANLTTREPGAVGGQFAGADIPPTAHQEWLDEVTATEHAREGGGGEAVIPKRATHVDNTSEDTGKSARRKTTKKY